MDREYHKQYYIEHKEEILARNREWAKANRERATERAKAWNKEHPERVRATAERNRDKYNDRQRARRIGRIEAARKQGREAATRWRKAHPEERGQAWRATRAKRLSAPGSHTPEEIARQREKQGHRCHYCLCDVSTLWTVEHKTPLSKGGSDSIENIVIACKSCNNSKGNKTEAEYKRYRLGLVVANIKSE